MKNICRVPDIIFFLCGLVYKTQFVVEKQLLYRRVTNTP